MQTRFVFALTVVALLTIGAQVTMRVRQPIAAGTWYPADRETLRESVQRYVDAAEVAVPEGRLVACIVPHGAYGLSGDVAAHAFKLLKTGQYSRVIVLSPSHFATFRGCSIAAVQTYRTPLGDVLLDGPVIRKLTFSTLFSTRALKYTSVGERAQLHEREHGIEVVLPFLQVQLGIFWLVPIVVGDLRDHSGAVDQHAINTIVRMLGEVIDDRTLLVVSSDFTHHGNAFSYRPFKENVLEGVERLDKEAFRLILKRDYAGFQSYLEETQNTICGKLAISILLKLLPKHAQGHLLAYDISARKTKDLSSAVGYAAIVFVDPTRPPAEPHPEAALPPPIRLQKGEEGPAPNNVAQ